MPLNLFRDDPWGALGQSIAAQRQPRVGERLEPLSESDQRNLLDSISSGALRGVGWLGGTLNKAFGGRAIRGLIGGKPNELLSIIPGSDTFGITDPANEVTGAELLGGDKNTPFFSGHGLAGLGLEIALDPSTYFGGAIVKGLGKGASMAGKLATKIPKAGPYIAGAGDVLSKLYTRTIPPLFEGAVKGMKTATGQTIARALTASEPELIAEAMGRTIPFAEKATAAGVAPDFLRDVLEGAVKPSGVVADVVKDPIAFLRAMQAEEAAKGLPGKTLAAQEALYGGKRTPLDYFPRQYTPRDPHSVREWWNQGSVRPMDLQGREDDLQRVFTTKLNELATEDMTGKSLDEVTEIIRDKYLGADANMAHEIGLLRIAVHQGDKTKEVALKEAEALFSSLKEQAEMLARKKIAGRMPEFLNDPVKDFYHRTLKHMTNIRKADGIYDGLGPVVKTVQEAPEGVPLIKALSDIGLTNSVPGQDILDAAGNVIGQTAPSGAQAEMFKRLQKLGKANTIDDLKNLVIDADVHADLTNFFKASDVEGLEQFKKIWDSITNLNKAFQTILWPANHARNQSTAMFMNFVEDAFDPTLGKFHPLGFIQPWTDAKTWYGGGKIAGLETKVPMFKGMTNEQAHKALDKLVLQYDPMRTVAKLHNFELGEETLGALKQREAFIPKSPDKGLLKSITDAGWGDPEAWTRPQVHGVMGATADTLPPVRAGRQFASSLDDVNRMSVFLAKLEQGLSPLDALKSATKSHYDFKNLSKFEREYMRRLVPFYGWMRQNVPAVISELVANPGGKMAQAIRVSTEMGGNEQGFTPDYLGAGIAARVGGEDARGMQRFISSTGLPFEDIGSLMQPSGWLGSLNPLLKAPLELATNRQFFTGRELTGTVPHTGSYAGDQILAATPFGRFGTTGRMLLDDERGTAGTKALNFLTGLRTSDVDMTAARRQAIRQAAEDLLLGEEGVGQFSRIYLKPEALDLLTPEQLRVYQLYQSSIARRRGQ